MGKLLIATYWTLISTFFVQSSEEGQVGDLIALKYHNDGLSFLVQLLLSTCSATVNIKCSNLHLSNIVHRRMGFFVSVTYYDGLLCLLKLAQTARFFLSKEAIYHC